MAPIHSIGPIHLALTVILMLGLTARTHAQDEPAASPPLATDASISADATVSTEHAGAGESVSPSATPNDVPVAHPEDDLPSLSWAGSIELDLGYAKYDAQVPSVVDDSFYDFRGRFVVGPTITEDLGKGMFFAVNGQLVAWAQEEVNRYQINVDDVWAKVGRRESWDLQLGRFETWSVYNKGLGFDLYTLEDTGALCEPPFSNKQYCADIYEANFIHLRENGAGTAAFHLFPTDRIGFELVGLYGNSLQANNLGSRLAARWVPIDALQLSAAGEYRNRFTSSPAKLTDPMGRLAECDKCSESTSMGVGGGAVVHVGPIELGANAAYGIVDAYQAVVAEVDPNASPDILSAGGFGDVTVGPIVVGGGANWTRREDRATDEQQHLQTSAVIYWPLPFGQHLSEGDARRAPIFSSFMDRRPHIKLVVSYASGEWDRVNLRDDPTAENPITNKLYAVRLRLKYFF